MRTLAGLSLITGTGLLGLAIAWWWLTYNDVVLFDYIGLPQATSCLFADTDMCRLARAICFGAHPREILTYQTSLLWAGAAVLSAGLFFWPPRRQT